MKASKHFEPKDQFLDNVSCNLNHDKHEAIDKRLRRERVRVGKPDLGPGFVVSGWEAYNAVQGYVQWDMPRKGDPSDFARVIRGASDPAVKKAEELALAV